MLHGRSAKIAAQGCVQADGRKDEASCTCATGVPEVVLHPSWLLLRKVVEKIGLLSSDQSTKRAKSNSPIGLLNCVFFCSNTIVGASITDGE